MKIKTLVFALLSCLCLQAAAQENIVDRLNKALGVRLPAEYEAKVRTFVDTSRIMKDKDAVAFTEQFITKEMKTDWGINKQNQLVFIWSSIYRQVNGLNYLYSPKLDTDENRLKDYKTAIRKATIECGKDYRNGFTAYMDQLSAEAQQRSAEAQQRSAAAIKEIMRVDSIGIKHMIEVYNLSHVATQEEIDWMKEATKKVIAQCKKYNIDYRAILRKELGDEKKVDEILKFYGVE